MYWALEGGATRRDEKRWGRFNYISWQHRDELNRHAFRGDFNLISAINDYATL
jgi:hypothetical protein